MTQHRLLPCRPGNLPALAALADVVDAPGHGQPRTATPLLARSRALRDIAANSRCVTDRDTPVGYGWVLPPPAGGDHVELPGGVHPAWRGRGIGRRLLDWQLARAAAQHAALAPHARWRARTTATADPSAVRLFQRAGLVPARQWLTMTRPTGRPFPPLRPASRPELDRYRPEHDRLVHDAHLAAYAGQWGFQPRPFDTWAPATVHGARFRPQWSFVAWAGPDVAGYVLCSAADTVGVLLIDDLAVVPGWRGNGIATALLAESLAAAGAAGATRAALTVDADDPTGALTVAARAGFRIAGRAQVYIHELPALRGVPAIPRPRHPAGTGDGRRRLHRAP